MPFKVCFCRVRKNEKNVHFVLKSCTFRFCDYIRTNIDVKNYFTKEFFHVFEISPINIDGEDKNQIRFKDTLVDACIAMRGNIPFVEDYVKACFHNAY